ncbi:hypothetical protein M3J09_008614 [Ascochyta lentis]
MGGAPAHFLGASKLSQTMFPPVSKISFATVAQQEASKAVITPQKLLARRAKQRCRIRRIPARPTYQQRPRSLAFEISRARRSGRSFWKGFNQVFWPTMFSIIDIKYFHSPKARSPSKTDDPQDEPKKV